ncbi:hypothetical protein Taro_033513 [Colocasia esculenta]|uniref:Uncharacterized protein n=1 Tax=Colocasia esculenta TaxID=4460 RepID=A0A843VU08_COLES|nr:hypothetical protein [Colocasia esculenta]
MVRRSFSRGCSVSLVVTPGCSFLNSWRSGMLGVCLGLLPHCDSHFTALQSSFASTLLEFLLLWLVAIFPTGSWCELQESVVVVTGCACCERVGVFARAKQMLVCRVALLVEHCNTCLWLLSALCWLVVNSSEVEVHRLAACVLVMVPRTVLLLS